LNLEVKFKLNSFAYLIVNKVLFGSNTDMEDVLAVLTKNFENINFNLLPLKTDNLAIRDEIYNLLQLYHSKQITEIFFKFSVKLIVSNYIVKIKENQSYSTKL
jgi:hypothetical protein